MLNFFLFYISFFSNYISSKPSNVDITKAVSCINIVIQKYKGNFPEQSTYFSSVLKCFMTITEEQANEIIIGLEQGQKTLDTDDIQNLTDISDFESIPEVERKESYERLDEVLKEIQRINENKGKKSSKSRNDDN